MLFLVSDLFSFLFFFYELPDHNRRPRCPSTSAAVSLFAQEFSCFLCSNSLLRDSRQASCGLSLIVSTFYTLFFVFLDRFSFCCSHFEGEDMGRHRLQWHRQHGTHSRRNCSWYLHPRLALCLVRVRHISSFSMRSSILMFFILLDSLDPSYAIAAW